MSLRMSRLAGLMGVSATIALVQPNIASAKSSVEIADTAKAITVLITEPNNVGSGVILQQQGDIYTVLTAAHVVKNKVTYKITTPDDRSYQIIPDSIRSAPGSIDLAVIKFKSTTKYPTAKLGNCNILKSGMDLYVGGFPSTSRAITQSVFLFREGKVSANSNKIFEKGYSLVYSNDTLPGMSGGAVLNGAGELVAIHGRGDRDERDIKTGFNLGIPINRFATVASNMGVNLGGQVAPIPQNIAPKADDYFVSGWDKSTKGDVRGALADYDRAIALDPKYALAYSNRGLLKKDKFNDVRGALADYDRAIALDPKNALTYSNRGLLKKDKLNDVRGALADYNEAISIHERSANAFDPKNALAYTSRGVLKYQNLSDIRGALADLTTAIKVDAIDVNAYYNRGNLFYSTGNRVAAIADFRQVAAIEGDPIYDLAEAVAEIANGFRKVAQIDRSRYQGLIAKGVIQSQQGAYPQAIDLFKQAAKISPEMGDIYKYRGEAFKQQGDRAAAIKDWRKAVQIYKNTNQPQDYQMVLGWLKSVGAGE